MGWGWKGGEYLDIEEVGDVHGGRFIIKMFSVKE
jgi:hypothetical protein